MALKRQVHGGGRQWQQRQQSHSVNTISSHFPIISKPATTLGKQIKVPGSHWEGRLTEEKNTMYSCSITSTSLPCTPSSAGAKSAAFKLETLPRLPQHLPQCTCPGARLRAYPTTPLTALLLALLFARWTRPRSLNTSPRRWTQGLET